MFSISLPTCIGRTATAVDGITKECCVVIVKGILTERLFFRINDIAGPPTFVTSLVNVKFVLTLLFMAPSKTSKFLTLRSLLIVISRGTTRLHPAVPALRGSIQRFLTRLITAT